MELFDAAASKATGASRRVLPAVRGALKWRKEQGTPNFVSQIKAEVKTEVKTEETEVQPEVKASEADATMSGEVKVEAKREAGIEEVDERQMKKTRRALPKPVHCCALQPAKQEEGGGALAGRVKTEEASEQAADWIRIKTEARWPA